MSFGQGLPSGGAIDAKVGKRKELDNWLEIGRITPEQYRLALEKEGLTDVHLQEHQQAKMKPLLSVGIGGGVGFGLALLAAGFIVWKVID